MKYYIKRKKPKFKEKQQQNIYTSTLRMITRKKCKQNKIRKKVNYSVKLMDVKKKKQWKQK